ncbi:MAG TPA: SGNH/GDSL hydrolase family protein [Myxococcaceae bacterium]|nr:SGNH/GDSL hydrolase family protein [Myxococcaceae bacterium]
MPVRLSLRTMRPVLALLAAALVAGILARYVVGVGAGAGRTRSVVVTFGDSLTEGSGSTGTPWPEVLAERLHARGGGRAPRVVNTGIGGNRLLRDGYGESGLARFDRDVLARPDVRWVTVLAGINDLGFPGCVEPDAPRVTAEELIAAHRQLIARAHAAGLKIYLGTLLPFEGTTSPGYFAADKERARQAVNAWIRTSDEPDGVIDFDAATRDPDHPTRLRPAYDSGDHLHPSTAGHRAMGEAVELRLFEAQDALPGG